MKISTVKSARKDQGQCEICRGAIKVGDGYRSIKPRFGVKRKRCMNCPVWKPSEMTNSKIATAYAAQEDANAMLDAMDVDEDNSAFVSNVQSILIQCAEGGEECKSDYEESLDNMPEGLQEGDSGQAIQEKIDLLDGWIQDLESWSPSSEEPIEGQDRDEWTNEVVDEAREIIGSLEV